MSSTPAAAPAGAGRTAAPAPSRRRQRDPLSLLADQLSPYEPGGARLQEPGEIRGVGTVEARAAETIAEADVKGAARLDTLGRHVEEPRHLLARDVAARRFVDLDEVGARRDETLQLLVDDLG